MSYSVKFRAEDMEMMTTGKGIVFVEYHLTGASDREIAADLDLLWKYNLSKTGRRCILTEAEASDPREQAAFMRRIADVIDAESGQGLAQGSDTAEWAAPAEDPQPPTAQALFEVIENFDDKVRDDEYVCRQIHPRYVEEIAETSKMLEGMSWLGHIDTPVQQLEDAIVSAEEAAQAAMKEKDYQRASSLLIAAKEGLKALAGVPLTLFMLRTRRKNKTRMLEND